MTKHNGMRHVGQADLRHWCEASGSPWKVPHRPREVEALPNETDHPPLAPRLDRDDSGRQADALDPREHKTLLALLAAAARAGRLDAAPIERATSVLGVTLSRRTIHKHLASIDDTIERRKDTRH